VTAILSSFDDRRIDAVKPKSTSHRDNRAAFDAGYSMLQLIAENSLDLLSVQSARGEFVYTSPNVTQLLGWTPAELRGVSIFALVHPDDVDRVAAAQSNHAERKEVRVRYRIKCSNGELRWVESRSRKTFDRAYVVAMTRDVEEEVAELRHLEQLATHDPLTNLPNRRGIEAALQSELERSCRQGISLTLAFFDIDRFKRINDTHGHERGDRVLLDVSRCVTQAKRSYDVLGRWGGDEFMLLMSDTRCDEAVDIVQRIRHASSCELPGITISFGISCNTDANSPEELIAQADAALYRGKRIGGNRIVTWRAGSPAEESSD
jgi:diguanylate cyclase (GGDEF)-like protein/PAS domain S-box-containing protein